jgi:hypothetical protein
MITDAIVLLGEKYKFSEAIFDMERYTKLTDSIFYEILRSNDKDEKTEEAKKILERIQQRNLYKFYGEFQPAKNLKNYDLSFRRSTTSSEINVLYGERLKYCAG